MILEYNYDNGNLVLDLFKQSALATLEIKTVTDKDEPRFVMEYSLVKDYSETDQAIIRKALSESLNERLQLANVLNQFIENQILNNVISFSLKFRAAHVRKCEITYSSSFKKAGMKDPKKGISDLVKCLEQLDNIVTDLGIGTQTVTGIFQKEGSGRNKKYVPLTVQEISYSLRHALTEE